VAHLGPHTMSVRDTALALTVMSQPDARDWTSLPPDGRDHRIGLWLAGAWVAHVGSVNERPGITGISHFFEHMMFNGTKTRLPGEFDRLMEGSGGRNNAYTSSDVTVYQNWFPSSVTGVIFDLESDRMRNLDFDAKKVESERGVVYSERRSSVDNDNFGTLLEQLKATAYVAHPYQIPTIGWPAGSRAST
jgi:predicted Zn-dependent peptidase